MQTIVQNSIAVRAAAAAVLFAVLLAGCGGGATQIYVTYARQSGADNHDQTNGAGLGLVDVFDANGVFVSRLVAAGGRLNAPWGVALAPADFGTLSNAVLIGNVGDGRINAFAAGIRIGSASAAPFTTVWDSTAVADGTVALNAKATDVDGNVGVAAADIVVSNATPRP